MGRLSEATGKHVPDQSHTVIADDEIFEVDS